MSKMASGVVAFSNLTEHDVFQGKSTGYYALTLALDEPSAATLASEGVKLRDYEGTPQRKFKTTYHVDVLNLDDSPFNGEIPFGSKVRVLYSLGKPNPTHGVPVYLHKVRLVELREGAGTSLPEEF